MSLKQLGCAILSFLAGLLIVVCIVHAGPIVGAINTWSYGVRKVDDSTRYSKRKEVEDTARAMIASYHKDKLMYEQYRKSENAEERSWGMQSRNRANGTASTYNNYLRENSFVWKDNIPPDIDINLAMIQE